MRKRIFRNMCFTAFFSVALTVLLVVAVVYKELHESMEQSVKNQAELVREAINLSGDSYWKNLKSSPDSDRITLIDTDGTVLYDNKESPGRMENHLDRPEIAAALQNGAGRIERLSETLDTKTFYYALRLENGMVVRVAGTSRSVFSAMASCLPWLFVIGVVMFCLSMLIARRQTAKIIVPINQIDLEDPLSNEIYEEFSPLLRRIAGQNTQIRSQMEQIREKQGEFSAITENMSEGLIVLNAMGTILSVNKSAVKMLGAPGEDYVSKNILTLNRSLLLQEAVEQASAGVACEKMLSLDNRQYQLLSNPVWKDGAVNGVLLLLLDVTEQQQAEQMRREFSANVSHELRTPLTSISGYAEIMKDGLVKPEDMRLFSARIYTEARRLIALVEDVLELSRLDEKNIQMQRERVNLLSLAYEVRNRLASRAQDKGVTVRVSGEPVLLYGVPAILEEILYNLCDNSIKYNQENGRVDITLSKTDGKAQVTVADTGIGISAEHQGRVFERFYRVDKSHSRETGGTGLGLSIVKHGVQYHGGSMELSSEPGKGTVIRILFPIGNPAE